MIKQIVKTIIEPEYYIENFINRYGNITSVFMFTFIAILHMFLNVVIYDKSLGNTLITLRKSIIESCILGLV